MYDTLHLIHYGAKTQMATNSTKKQTDFMLLAFALKVSQVSRVNATVLGII